MNNCFSEASLKYILRLRKFICVRLQSEQKFYNDMDLGITKTLMINTIVR